MKNTLVHFFAISCFAQSPKSEFDKTVESINVIIKANPLAYYIAKNQYSEFITKISTSPQGIVSYTDSIPAEPKNKININTTVKKKELISDCCPRKNSRSLDILAINKWEIHFPYLGLKDKNNETFATFIGFKKTDLEKLEELFDTLKALCKKEE